MFNRTHLRDLLAKAYSLALKSPDPSSQNGSVIAVRKENGDMEIIGEGFNHPYDGVSWTPDDRDQKLKEIEHAERDSIFDCGRKGFATQGAIMICPWAACYDCARAIIGSGCQALVYHKQRYLITDKRWIDQVNEAIGWIEKAGIFIYEFDGPVTGTKPILVSSKLWSPASCGYVPEAATVGR